MKLKLLFISFLFLSSARSQNTDNKIVIGKIDSLYSKVIGEERKIWVYVPDGGNNAIFSQQHYLVVYLMDGDAHFYSVMGMIQQLSEVNGNTVCPEMIVVGIPNTDRSRDLTPTNVASGGPFNFTGNSGGGEKFTSFIEKELIPHIDSLYPTTPYRMLIGHSLGGLMVVNTLINHTDLFDDYLAIDPSLWWDNQKLLKQAKDVLHQKRFDNKTLFLAVANTMADGMDTMRVVHDTTGNTIHIRSILEFAKTLKANNTNGLRWSYKYYNDDSHGSVPLIGEYDALRFMFDFYQMPSLNKLFDSTFSATASVSMLQEHYKKVSKEMGYAILPPEDLINGLGYNFMQSGMMDKSYAFFKLNIDNYPQSFNVYDSMGDFYAGKKDKQKAMEYYSKALSIKPGPETKKKLDDLNNGK
jgi:predicted alpha/beta superfamily hydrolase